MKDEYDWVLEFMLKYLSWVIILIFRYPSWLKLQFWVFDSVLKCFVIFKMKDEKEWFLDIMLNQNVSFDVKPSQKNVGSIPPPQPE